MVIPSIHMYVDKSGINQEAEYYCMLSEMTHVN